MAEEAKKHTLLDTEIPVLVPPASELVDRANQFVASLAPKTTNGHGTMSLAVRPKVSDGADLVGIPAPPHSAFMEGLTKSAVPTLDGSDGKMLTENGDVTFSTSGDDLVDLFYELVDAIDALALAKLLEDAWKTNAQVTLKIIWNARSIHLGKGDKYVFYRCIGWLYEKHPLTLLGNLPWLVRPVIAKKAPTPAEKQDKKEKQEIVMVDAEDTNDGFEMIETDEDVGGASPRKKIKLDEDIDSKAVFDVKYGVSHGYWKDLLNIVALAANDELKVDGDIRKVLNPAKPLKTKPKLSPQAKRTASRVRIRMARHEWTKEKEAEESTSEKDTVKKSPAEQQPWARNWEKGGDKKALRKARYESAMEKLEKDPKYTALYVNVARLFAEQLKMDIDRLGSTNAKDQKLITLCGKWAPSHDGMHDKHTFIVSTIAEMLYSFDTVCPYHTACPAIDPGDRTLYLKHARQAYQVRTLSKLRKHLEVVERPMTENKYEDIIYPHVPSIAMQNYTNLFIEKDPERFDKFLDGVAEGTMKISGATLTPSSLVREVTSRLYQAYQAKKDTKLAQSLEAKKREIQMKRVEGQWNTLVQRVKDAGALSSSIAVCDVSGSMNWPRLPDGTTPIDAAIGLSLLIAEVTEPPFGGAFITFSADPAVVSVGGAADKRTFPEKVNYIEGASWSMNTDFVAVFEKLILPMAKKNKLRQDQMVKRVFVFSDMQFDAASGPSRWSSSYERIKGLFAAEGYEMPELVFWNLAGQRTFGAVPVDAKEEGCELISGYSQAMLKVFMEGGELEEEEKGENGEVKVKEKGEKTPLETVMKAVGAEGYRMLEVVD